MSETGSITVGREGELIEINFAGLLTIALTDATAHDIGKLLIETAGLET